MKIGLIGSAYDVLRRVTPAGARKWLKRQPWFVPVLSRTVGNAAYSRSYYSDIERIEAESVRVMAAWIVDHIEPSDAVDIGCGPGHLTAALRQLGVKMECCDISGAAMDAARKKGLEVYRCDLTQPGAVRGKKKSLGVCCEVAEHLGPEYADEFVSNLAASSDTIFMTAAEPQVGAPPGLYHVNEQPNSYWIDKMADNGFVLDNLLTKQARDHFGAEGVISYLAKPLIFRLGS